MGGLAAAALLAHRGFGVTVLERADAPGGKMRQVSVAGRAIDAGPTVFTMRWVFEALFAECGARLDEAVGLTQAGVLARHAWGADRLDLHADAERSAAAIEAFAGPAEARGFRSFCAAARRIYQTLEGPFIRGERPSMASLALSVRRPADLLAIKPFATLWGELGTHFRDPRLRQLFGRYATYCGSSPFLAPATLMLVADVEQQGVCYVDGGMHALARALAALAAAGGAEIRYGADVAEIATQAGRVSGVRLASGEMVAADAVIANA
ncbi:MAG: FAD-dependent oxidoreductase, partial [Sphingomonas sp.]